MEIISAFGKRFPPPTLGGKNFHAGILAEKIDGQFEVFTGLPWAGEDYAPCNYAVGHLHDYLWSALSTKDGVVQAETLFAAIGCIAGMANQKHVFRKLYEAGYMIAPPAIQRVRASNGLVLFSGSALSAGLINDKHNKQKGLEFWPIILTGALLLGMDDDTKPSIEAMKKHVQMQEETSWVLLCVSSCQQPRREPQELIKLVWPLAKRVFSGDIDHDINYGEVKLKYMAAVCGYVVQQYLEMLQHRFPIGIALTIAMESALYTSRLPDSILD